MSSFTRWPHQRDCQAWLAGFALQAPPIMANHAVMHSKQVKQGDVFFACGPEHSRQQHIQDALQQGAVVIVQPGSSDSVAEGNGIVMVAVKDWADRCGEWLSAFYGDPSHDLRIIAITGTNGKTSCSIFVAQLCEGLGVQCGVIGTLGVGLWPNLDDTGLTTPDGATVHRALAYLKAQGATMVAMEASSHGLAQGRLQGVDIDIGVLTNISQDHLDYHHTMADYTAAKAKLFQQARITIYNTDDERGWQWFQNAPPGRAFSYGWRSSGMMQDVSAKDVVCTEQGFEAQLLSPKGLQLLSCPLAGTFQVSNVLASLTAMLACDFDWLSLMEAVPQLMAVPGRMQYLDVSDGAPRVVVDYAHTPDALAQTLQSLRLLSRGRLWCVFGCGGDRDRSKRALMAQAAEQYSDHVVVTSDNPRSEDPTAIMRDICQGFSGLDAVVVIESRAEAIAYAIDEAKAGDTICIAGKGHETYQLIGDQRLAFSDAECATKALATRGAPVCE